VLADANCQPIIFVGSGFTKRYAGGPSWEELLKQLAKDCPLIEKDFAYYKQTYGSNFIKIGAVFAEAYHAWAWGDGRANFPEEFFSEKFPREIFIKHAVATILLGLDPEARIAESKELAAEIEALKAMSPHAIVTTNYDELIEPIFPDYERVIGQKIFRRSYLSIGEIFKIHGCATEPLSIILTDEDYDRFNRDHMYLTSKLLTYFVEHPLLFIGYRAEDPNIKAVLYDVHRMIKDDFEIVPNMYILEWDPDLTEDSYPPRDKVLSVGDDLNIRIKSITASSFEWVYKAFGVAGSLDKVNTKLLRALMARSFDLIRTDAPKKSAEIDFQTLEHALESGETFAKLFGVTAISDPSQVNLNYPYTLTGVAEQLGYGYWSKAQDLINNVERTYGFAMKESDNAYHISMRTGTKASSKTNKYSQKAVDLLRRVRDGEAVKIE
jgi:hypothetical protein